MATYGMYPWGPLAEEYVEEAVTSMFVHAAAPAQAIACTCCRRAQQVDELLRQFPGCRAINPDR